MIKDSSTGNFDQQGLFSEFIFGEIGTPERASTHGFIELHTTVFHQEVFHLITQMKNFYEDIMRGVTYAYFDKDIKDFIVVPASDDRGDTGYSFFVKHVKKIDWGESTSNKRKTRVKGLEKCKANWFIDKCLVIPAGARDYYEDDGRGKSDEINVQYVRVLKLATSLQGVDDTTGPIFDMVRWHMQQSVNGVFDYLWKLYSMDNGFLQGSYNSRSIVRATRNVMVAGSVVKSPDNPGATLMPDEILLPLYQAMAAFMPVFKYKLRVVFFDVVFSIETDTASLIDPNTLKLIPVELDVTERSKYLASDSMEDMINSFRDHELRHLPVTVVGADHKPYYLWLKYKDGDRVIIGRNVDDILEIAEAHSFGNVTADNISPITYFEMYYIACFLTTRDKHVTATRYPVLHQWSIFPAKVHLGTTTEFSGVKLYPPAESEEEDVAVLDLPRWPTPDSASINGVAVHPCQLPVTLNGDLDGDMINNIGVLSEDANKECGEYLEHARSILDPNGKPIISLETDLAKITLYSLTKF